MDSKHRMIRAALILGLAFFASSVWASNDTIDDVQIEAPPAESAWRLSLDIAYRYGPLRGYLQIPKGGRRGSTTIGRPTFSDLGYDMVGSPQIQLSLGYKTHMFFVESTQIRISGSKVLTRSFRSQSSDFTAGATAQSRINLSRYRLGFREEFNIELESLGTLTVSPNISLVGLEYFEQITDSAGGRMSRGFRHPAPALGVDVKWQLSRDLAINLSVWTSPPGLGNFQAPFLFSSTASIEYRLWGNPHSQASITLGIAVDECYFADRQPIPNVLRYSYGPAVVAGIRFDF